jgi:hypothetical protein
MEPAGGVERQPAQLNPIASSSGGVVLTRFRNLTRTVRPSREPVSSGRKVSHQAQSCSRGIHAARILSAPAGGCPGCKPLKEKGGTTNRSPFPPRSQPKPTSRQELPARATHPCEREQASFLTFTLQTPAEFRRCRVPPRRRLPPHGKKSKHCAKLLGFPWQPSNACRSAGIGRIQSTDGTSSCKLFRLLQLENGWNLRRVAQELCKRGFGHFHFELRGNGRCIF